LPNKLDKKTLPEPKPLAALMTFALPNKLVPKTKPVLKLPIEPKLLLLKLVLGLKLKHNNVLLRQRELNKMLPLEQPLNNKHEKLQTTPVVGLILSGQKLLKQAW
jgi:hypothetical protein